MFSSFFTFKTSRALAALAPFSILISWRNWTNMYSSYYTFTYLFNIVKKLNKYVLKLLHVYISRITTINCTTKSETKHGDPVLTLLGFHPICWDVVLGKSFCLVGISGSLSPDNLGDVPRDLLDESLSGVIGAPSKTRCNCGK